MRALLAILVALGACGAALADVVVATRNVRALEVIGPGDVGLVDGSVPGGAARLEEVIGLEARVMIYAGRPVRPEQLGPPALIDRNQLVVLVYASGSLRIEVEGRALDRAAVGERVRVMNLSSRRMVRGVVLPDGTIAAGT